MSSENTSTSHPSRYTLILTLGALGVVFGDIGTSPLYALRECFHGPYEVAASLENVLGVLSLIVWSLIVVVSVKYLSYVMRADNRGEGGALALMALALAPHGTQDGRRKYFIELLGLTGAALIYGDGMITPAISVLSAVEGLTVVTSFFEPYVVSITIGVLIGLFVIQRRGTAKVGSIFGPIILVWFITIAILGLGGILSHPSVMWAFNPWYAVKFLFTNGTHGFFVLGAVFLVCTGAEALYADMGHFGKKPITLGWFAVALPCLLLNYFGQGAILLVDAAAHKENPFFHLAPAWAVLPLVVLATLATVIASQALISGAFSMTRQAVQLGFLPRLQIEHTSERQIGQIYIPLINWLLLLATILLVLTFRSSSNLATAYGLSVATVIVITTTLMFFVARDRWKWPPNVVWTITICFLIVDLSFLFANMAKFWKGGWVPVIVGAGIFTIMATWRSGRQILATRLRETTPPFAKFLSDIKTDNSIRVPGTAIFMTRNIEGTPTALLHNVKHNKVIHKTVILLMVETQELPRLSDEERIDVDNLDNGFYAITIRFGFMETPDVPLLLDKLHDFGLEIKLSETTFFLGRETVLPTDYPGMAIWRERLFAFLSQNSARATAFFQIPPGQVIEIGFQIEI